MTDSDPVVEATNPDPSQQLALGLAEQLAALQRGANWFYWIAGLSLVNSGIAVAGGAGGFIVGLGVTQIVDGIAGAVAQDLDGNGAMVVKGVAFVIDLLIAGVLVLFGWFANKGHSWAFLVGLILYGMDGLLFLLFQDWLAVGFHVFAGFGILSGYLALRKLRAFEVASGRPAFETDPA